MNIFEGIFLGLVQGLTEFLPVSSSGHLVLFQRLFGITEGVLTFDIAVHLATLAAVISIFRKDILQMIKKPFGKLALLVIAGTVPTAVIGVAFNDLFDKLFETGASLGIEFILTGVVLLYADSVRTRNKGLDRMKFPDAVFIGTAQGLAILPAVSRSGLTITGALARGLDRQFAARFSFLVSIPAILGAAAKDCYQVVNRGEGLNLGVEPLVLAAGMAAAAVSGYFAVKFMLRLLAKGRLRVFSYYVFVLGALVLADQLFAGRFFYKLF